MSITGVFNNVLDKVGLYPPPWALKELCDCLREPTKDDDLRKLLGKYPDAAKWTAAGMKPLEKALWHKNPRAAKVLAEADPSILKPAWRLDSNTPLRDIVTAQNAKSLSLLASLGADVKETDHNGDTLLHHLAMTGSKPDFVDLLVQLGADPKAKNEKGETPLVTAVRRGKLIEAFYAHDSDLSQRNGYGDPLIMIAARGESPETAVAALAALGANLEAKQDPIGPTALEQALTAGNAKAITALLQAGAEFDSGSPLANTARVRARNNADHELLKLLNELPEAREARREARLQEMAARRDKIKQEEMESCTEGLDEKLTVKPIRLKKPGGAAP
ncbi:MAG: ankyrin repeat domain-containing protein [Alphaproteobacteria bacterium]